MIGDISLMDNYVNFISRHHGRRGPKEPIFRVVVPFAVLINASFTYSELNITIPEDSLDIVARALAENPISSARLSSQVTQSQCLGSSCGSRHRAAFSKSDEKLITKERLKMSPAIYKDVWVQPADHSSGYRYDARWRATKNWASKDDSKGNHHVLREKDQGSVGKRIMTR
jgi:hypothetical protein